MMIPKYTTLANLDYHASADCVKCNSTTTAYVFQRERLDHAAGQRVQQAYRRLSSETREALFISGLCERCQLEIWPKSDLKGLFS